jgi:hypothetical protein
VAAKTAAERINTGVLDAIDSGDITCHTNSSGGRSYSHRRTDTYAADVYWAIAVGLAWVTGGGRVRLTNAGRRARDEAKEQ